MNWRGVAAVFIAGSAAVAASGAFGGTAFLSGTPLGVTVTASGTPTRTVYRMVMDGGAVGAVVQYKFLALDSVTAVRAYGGGRDSLDATLVTLPDHLDSVQIAARRPNQPGVRDNFDWPSGVPLFLEVESAPSVPQPLFVESAALLRRMVDWSVWLKDKPHDSLGLTRARVWFRVFGSLAIFAAAAIAALAARKPAAVISVSELVAGFIEALELDDTPALAPRIRRYLRMVCFKGAKPSDAAKALGFPDKGQERGRLLTAHVRLHARMVAFSAEFDRIAATVKTP